MQRTSTPRLTLPTSSTLKRIIVLLVYTILEPLMTQVISVKVLQPIVMQVMLQTDWLVGQIAQQHANWTAVSGVSLGSQ